MGKKSSFRHLLFPLLCAAALGCVICSCSAHRGNTRQAVSYSKQKTRQPRWNATTSQTTTYYIKKHSTRKRHNP